MTFSNATTTSDVSAATLKMLSQWNYEIAALYGKRLHECWALPFTMMLCTSFDDVADVQQKYGETLLADYRAAAEKISRSFHHENTSQHVSAAGEAYSAALLKAQNDARNIIEQAQAQAQRMIADAEALIVPRHTDEADRAA